MQNTINKLFRAELSTHCGSSGFPIYLLLARNIYGGINAITMTFPMLCGHSLPHCHLRAKRKWKTSDLMVKNDFSHIQKTSACSTLPSSSPQYASSYHVLVGFILDVCQCISSRAKPQATLPVFT